MSTTADLIAETRRYLYSPIREPKNKLEGAHDASTTTWSFERDINFSAGDTLAVGLEIVYVWEADNAGGTAEVERGWDGSTPAAHADGALVHVKPSFSDFAIFQALNADLADLSAPTNGLFKLSTVELNFNPAISTYELDTSDSILDVFEVRYETVGPSKDWPVVDRWEFDRNADVTDFPSGYSLTLWEGGEPGRKVLVEYKAAFSPLVSLTSNVQTVAGLSTFADDIPPLGAAYRLSSVREVSRNLFENQGDTRRAEEVPPGSQLRGAGGLLQVRQQRIVAEAARLSQQCKRRK